MYAGAIPVLYLFILMLLNLKTDERYFHSKTLHVLIPTAIGFGYVAFLLVQTPLEGAWETRRRK
ncbi:hypothetical protein W02_20740 [Nitrospira sp. KM1]|uniref:NADH-quinone oxidoreductase subunit J n=1 Tax=Nitrospira sp. KM1 TaxID=1936990 RepID=UPI0013A72205|nr:NADH-quinone oxidoreductase subunit J [Nitrospira sp. KM1]BCA54934.1 hypothetical protein W02_20740 [Nitrospira sp. KM1]